MAAPTVSLYVAPSTATRMAPCPVHAAIDFGEIEKSIRNGTYTWETVNSGTTINPQVNADNLDGDETADDTTAQTFTGNDHVDINSTSVSSTRTNGLFVFPSVTIPTGKAIVSANLRLWANTVSNARMSIYGEDVDSAADLSTTADINGRTLTTANVAWNDTSLATGQYHNSPDISTVVQELYDRQGEFSSANIGIICQATNTGGAQLFRAASYFDNGLTESAILTIEYADAPLSSEYKLSSHTVAQLTRSGDTPSNIVVNENGSPMSEGTVGSLAAGEWGQSGGELYVRLTDSADPESKADDYLDISFDVSTTGDGSQPAECEISWEASRSGGLTGWLDRYRYCTDPRPDTSSATRDLADEVYGFCYGPILTEGDWTISVTIKNKSGSSTTDSTSPITIAANTRTEYVIDSGGGGDFTDIATAISTHGASDDIQYTVVGGLDEQITSNLNITGSNALVQWDRTGNKPEIMWNNASAGKVFQIGLDAENCVLDGLKLGCDTTIGQSDSTMMGVYVYRSNNTGLCEIDLLGAVNPDPRLYMGVLLDATCTGLSLINCTSEVTTGYSVTGQGGSIYTCVFEAGCDFGISTNESTFRTVGSWYNVNIIWSTHTEDSKSALRFSSNEHLSLYYSVMNGEVWLGQISDLELQDGADQVRVEGNDLNNNANGFSIRDNLHNWIVCNNQFDSLTMSIGNNPQFSTISDGGFYCNTVLSVSDNDLFNGGGDGTVTNYSNLTMQANMLVLTDPASRDANDTYLNTSDVCFDSITDNVYPLQSTTGINDFALEESGGVGSLVADLAAWNAKSYVGTDVEADVVLSDGVPTSETVVTVDTPTMVFRDYYGNARASTSYAGAVIAANPSSGGGSSRNLLLLGVG